MRTGRMIATAWLRRRIGVTGRLPLALGLAVATAGCADGLFRYSSSTVPPPDSLTVQRVTGRAPEVEPLRPEPGDMWPAEEAPRATLANPEEALQGIPTYRPGSGADAPETPPPPPPIRRRGSSSLPPDALPVAPERRSPVAEPALPVTPPPPRREGRPVQLPDGSFATGTGDTGRVQGLVTQGGGTGAAVDQGNTEVIIGPDGQVRQVLRPR